MKGVDFLNLVGEYLYALKGRTTPKQYIRELPAHMIGVAASEPHSADYIPDDAVLTVLGLMALCPTFRQLGFEGRWCYINDAKVRDTPIVRGFDRYTFRTIGSVKPLNPQLKVTYPAYKLEVSDFPSGGGTVDWSTAFLRLSKISEIGSDLLCHVFYVTHAREAKRVVGPRDLTDVLNEITKLIYHLERNYVDFGRHL